VQSDWYREGWWADFLHAYEQYGGFYRAAKDAGVTSALVFEAIARYPEFRAACEEARQRFADTQEENLDLIGRAGNPVGPIVLLKKHRPLEYVDKNLTMNVTATTHLDSADGARILAAMMGAPEGATTMIERPRPDEPEPEPEPTPQA